MADPLLSTISAAAFTTGALGVGIVLASPLRAHLPRGWPWVLLSCALFAVGAWWGIAGEPGASRPLLMAAGAWAFIAGLWRILRDLEARLQRSREAAHG